MVTTAKKLHIQSTGQKAGQWVECGANFKCRNESVHVTFDTMKSIQEAYKNATGKTISRKDVTPELIEKLAIKSDNDKVSVTLANIKQITGDDVTGLKDARDSLKESYYRSLGTRRVDYTESNVEKQAFYIAGGKFPDKYDFSLNENSDSLTVKNTIPSCKTEEEYNRIVDSLLNDNLSDGYSLEISRFQPGREGTITRTYPMPGVVKEMMDGAKFRSKNSEILNIAQDEVYPDWAVCTPSSNTNAVVEKIARAQKQANKDLAKTHQAVIQAEKSAQRAEAYKKQFKKLQTELNSASASLLNANPSQYAELKTKINGIRSKLEETKRNFDKASANGNSSAITKASTEYKKAEAVKNQVNSISSQDAYAMTVEWLATRHPAPTVEAKRQAAEEWISKEPYIVNRIVRKYFKNSSI